MTLEELYADWEAKRDRFLDFIVSIDPLAIGKVGSELRIRHMFRHLLLWTPDDWKDADGSRYFEPLAMIEAAKLYCIARDEGISAAVMWKLANGGSV